MEKHKELLILIDIECTSIINPDPTLAMLWNCPSTADLVILTTQGNGGYKPCYVHKRIMLSKIPKIFNIVTTVQQDDPDPSPGSESRPVKKRQRKRKNKKTNVDERQQLRTNANIPAQGRPQSNVNGDFEHGPPEGAAEFLALPMVATVLDPCVEPVRLQQSSHATYSSPLRSHLLSIKEDAIAYTTRNEREIWLWPPKLPANWCHDIIKWVYLRESASTIDFYNFNKYMTLLEDLDQVEHFQMHALKARAGLKSEDPIRLLSYPGMKESHAKTFLRASLKQRMDSIVWNSVGVDNISHLSDIDNTGIVGEIIAGLEI